MMQSVGNTHTGAPVSARRSPPATAARKSHQAVLLSHRTLLPQNKQASHALALHNRGAEPLNEADASARFHVIDIGGPQGLEAELAELAKLVRNDDNVVLHEEHWGEYLEQREEFLKNGENFEKVLEVLHKLLGNTPEQVTAMYAGFNAAGKVYSMRSAAGTLINALPAVIPFLAHNAAPAAALTYAKVRCAATIGCALTGGIVNIFTLTYLLDSHDLLFRGAPNIARAMGTPQMSKIKPDLKKLKADVETKMGEVETARKELAKDPENAQLQQNFKKLATDTHDMIIGGVFTYKTRSQLNTVYFKGLENQALMATCKMYINLAAPWVGYAMNDQRMSAATQLVGCVLHVVGNYLFGGRDKITEQNEMIKVMIMTSDTKDKVKTMMRSPYKIRAGQAKQLFDFQIAELDQKISSALGLDSPDTWRQYAKLSDRDEYPGKLAALQALRDEAFNQLEWADQMRIPRLEPEHATAIKDHDYERANALCEKIAGVLHIPVDAYKEYSQLQAQSAMSPEERDTFHQLSAQVSEGYEKLSPKAKTSFDALKTTWKNTRHDARYVEQRNFTAVSAENQQTLHDLLQISPSARKSTFSLAPEFKVGILKGGERRSNSPDEVTANFAATQWKTWQWIVGGPYGSLILGAIMGVLAAQEKTKDSGYEQPVWQRGAVTGLVGVALLANMIAAYFIMSASARPNDNKLKLQVLAGTTGSLAEGSLLNHKLDYRKDLRAGNYPNTGLFHKNVGNYLTRAISASFNPSKLFVLPGEARHAKQASSSFNALMGMLEILNGLNDKPKAHAAVEVLDDTETVQPYQQILTPRNKESSQSMFTRV